MGLCVGSSGAILQPYGLCGSLCGSILQPWSGVSVDLCVVPSGSMVQLWVLCATNRFRKLLLNDGVANAQTMQKNSMFCNPFLCEFALHIHTKMHSIISNAANITKERGFSCPSVKIRTFVKRLGGEMPSFHGFHFWRISILGGFPLLALE